MPARRRPTRQARGLKAHELAYPAHLEAEGDGGYVVTFPDFGMGATQGDNFAEALGQAADLLETMVANYMAEGWDLPAPSAAAERPLVRLAPLVAAKAELYRAMRTAGISKAELARRAGVSAATGAAAVRYPSCLAPGSNRRGARGSGGAAWW